MKPLFILLFAGSLMAAGGQPASENLGLVLLNDYTDIELPCQLNMERMEFSSLCRWKQQIFLIPENDLCELREIYSIDSASLAANYKHLQKTDFETYRIKKFDRTRMTNGETYDGIEAAVIVNGKIYIAVETNSEHKNCYIVPGEINSEKRTIAFQYESKLALRRPFCVNNAGFESLAFLNGELLAIYEFNNTDDDRTAYHISTDAKPKLIRTSKIKSIYFRITDMEPVSTDTLIAINHYYTEDDEKYVQGYPQKEKIKDAGGKEFDFEKDCLTRLVRIYKNKQNQEEYDWEVASTTEFSDINWEGIVPFDSGYLLIEDGNNNPSYQQSRLRCVGCKTVK